MTSTKKTYKLLLINPQNQRRKGFVIDRESSYPPISLGIIAAMTSSNWEVEIHDEQFDPFVYKEADLVGFTAFTAQVTRAYEIAEIYNNKGIKTIIGGIHASMMPDEAEKYCHSVIQGEAESIWPQVIDDFEQGKLKRRYKGELIPMNNFPKVRHDLLHKNYVYSSIQTTRGCPWQCEFCSVHQFNGRKYRARPTSEVLDEMEMMQHKRMFIVDDNLIGYSKQSKERATQLFQGMIDRKLNIEWFTQTSLNFGDDLDLVKLAYEAGCRMVLIGIESEKEAQLSEQNKSLNLNYSQDKYAKAFETIHSGGVSILGTFIFGLDADTIDDLHARADYILNSGVDAIQTSILTPMPGTILYDRMQRENRILANNYPNDWQKYHATEVVFKPKRMSAEELQENMYEVWHKLYNKKTFLKKFIQALRETKSARSAAWSLTTNIHYHNINFEGTGHFIDPKDLYSDMQLDKLEPTIKINYER